MYFSEKPAIQYKACRAQIPKKTTGSKGAESGYSATLYGRARGELPSGSINMKIKIDRTEGRYSLCLPLLKDTMRPSTKVTAILGKFELNHIIFIPSSIKVSYSRSLPSSSGIPLYCSNTKEIR